MQVKQLQLPQLPQPRRKTGKCWMALFGEVNRGYDADDTDTGDLVDGFARCYPEKPTDRELIEELEEDPDWELISLMEITV